MHALRNRSTSRIIWTFSEGSSRGSHLTGVLLNKNAHNLPLLSGNGVAREQGMPTRRAVFQVALLVLKRL